MCYYAQLKHNTPLFPFVCMCLCVCLCYVYVCVCLLKFMFVGAHACGAEYQRSMLFIFLHYDFIICVYVCLCTRAGWCMVTHICVWRPEVNIRSPLFCTSFFWDRLPHWTWSSPVQVDWLVSEPTGSTCLCLPNTGFTDRCHHTTGMLGDLNSGPHAHVSSTLPT